MLKNRLFSHHLAADFFKLSFFPQIHPLLYTFRLPTTSLSIYTTYIYMYAHFLSSTNSPLPRMCTQLLFFSTHHTHNALSYTYLYNIYSNLFILKRQRVDRVLPVLQAPGHFYAARRKNEKVPSL